ncbi:electron transfer flavoprotein subunit beta, partial [Enterobacter hormaechei]|nr:electron transfer flavoprotein subunit beta [Enterobacter hormaechei]
HLDIPQVTYVQDVKVEGETLIVNRALEDGHQVVEVKTPCLLTAIEELNSPRYMNVARIFETNDDEIKVMGAADIDVPVEELGLKGSPTKVKKSMTKEVKGQGELVKQEPKDAVTYVLGKLKEKHYI